MYIYIYNIYIYIVCVYLATHSCCQSARKTSSSLIGGSLVVSSMVLVTLAFARCRHSQYCMVYIAIKRGVEGKQYIAQTCVR